MRPQITGLFFFTAGCSTIGGTAIPTGSLHLPAHYGEVAIYTTGAPQNATELGLVEVHAEGSEANVEALFLPFVQKVAGLGGDAAVIESIEASYALVTSMHVETYTYPCGYVTCTSTRMVPTTTEVVTVRIAGRAEKRLK